MRIGKMIGMLLGLNLLSHTVRNFNTEPERFEEEQESSSVQEEICDELRIEFW